MCHIPLVHGGGHTINMVGVASQYYGPIEYNFSGVSPK
jgi:hypothetical protein